MTDLSALPIEATTSPTIEFPETIAKKAKAADKPDAKREALCRMEENWDLPDRLMGGTRAMHDAGEDVLIREQDETDDEFKRRMSRTALTNYYGETISRHASKPFATEVQFDPPLPERLAYLEKNADGCGRSFTVFLREMLVCGIHRGLCHVLVDVAPNAGGTFAAQLQRRPLLHRIDPPCLLDVREVPRDDGEAVVYARMKQQKSKSVGVFRDESSDTVLVIQTDGVKGGASVVYERNVKGGWTLTESLPYTRPTIPLFTFYTQQEGPHEGKPAYLPLAELNLLHFQSDADQRHALSYGRRQTLVQTGWRTGANPAEAAAKGSIPMGQKTVLGYGRRLRHDAPDAKAYFLETSAAGLNAGAEDLRAIEERMEKFSAQQVSKSGGITATSRRLDNASDTCNLEAWCTRLEHVALQALRAAAEWVGVTLPEAQKVMIDRSFADDTPPSEDVPTLVQMARDKTLSLRTTIAELKARNVLQTIDDPDQEVQAIADEAEQLGAAVFDQMAAKVAANRQPPAIGGDPHPPGHVDPNAPPDAGAP